MSSVLKNEVLSKRRSNKYVHSNPALQKDEIKSNPERPPRASRIPRNPVRSEAMQGLKVSGCKQKSKDIFKYSESFDFETSELKPKHANSAVNKNETNSTNGSIDKRTVSNRRAATKDIKNSILEAKMVRNSENIHQNECKTHQISHSSQKSIDPKRSTPDQDSRVSNKDQLCTENTFSDPQSPHNRSDQENIGDELMDTSQKEKNKHVEKNQDVIETVKQPRTRAQTSSSIKPMIPKNNLDKEKVQKPMSKNTTKAFNFSDVPTKNIAKPSTFSANHTAQTRKLCKTALSVAEKNNTRNTNRETHLIQTENKLEQNNRQDLSKLSKQVLLKQQASAKTSKNDKVDSRHVDVPSNERSKPKLNERSLKKHNQAHKEEEDKRLQQDNLSRSLSKSITSNTSSTSSNYNREVSGLTESETESAQAKEIRNSLSKEACSGKSSCVKKKHVPIVTETKTSVLRRSRSRSITPGSSSVSSDSSNSNSTSSRASAKSCQSSGSAMDEKIRELSKDSKSKLSKSTKTQKNNENGKKEIHEPIKSYMRTTESAKNRGAIPTDLNTEAKKASANRKQSVQLSVWSESKQEIKSLPEKKKQEIKEGAGKISVNKSKLCKPSTREATSKLKVTNTKLGDVPLGSTSESADPTHGKIPFTSKDKQSKLMATKTGNLSDKLPIKHPIRKSSTSVGNNVNIKESGSGKSSAVTTDKNLKPVRRASPKCATESESSNEQTCSANKSAKAHNSSAIKSDSCKNRTRENKSKLIAPLPRNVRSPVSKVPKHSSRSLSNKSENSGNLFIDKQDIKAKSIKSKLQQKHADKSSGREFDKKLLQPNNAQHDREINQTNGDRLCEEYTSNNYSCDNPEKLLLLGKISSGKEKQLLSKENDHFCDREYVEVERDLFSPGNIVLHESPSENDDQCGSKKISEISHFTESLLKTGRVHVMKHIGDGLTVMNDKNLVFIETVCASAPECSEGHENGHSSVVKLDSLSCSENDGRAVNRLETTEGKMDTRMGSIISEQVPENNVHNTMDRNVESRDISTDICNNECTVFTVGINSNLDKCDNEIISSNQLDRHHNKHVTNHETGDVCNVAYDNPEIISDALTSEMCMSSMTQNCNKECDSAGVCTSFMPDFQEKNSDDSAICKTNITENLEQTKNEQRSAYAQRFNENESMRVCPQISDDDRINSYMLIETDDGSRHQWRGHGCVSQQNDNAADKDENIKFCHTGALGSKETDKSLNETHILCSKSILYKDGTSDKALSKHSTSLSSQTDEVLLHRNSCEQDQFNSQKTYQENSPCINNTKVLCDSFSTTDYKEIDENEIICVKKQENIKNRCQTICEKSEVQGTFTSNKMKQPDKQECKSNLCNKTVISPEIERSGSEHFDVNFCEKSIVGEDVRARENNRITEHHNTSYDSNITSDRNYDKGSSEICEHGSLSVFVSEKSEENVNTRGQDTSDDVKSIKFDNIALLSSECNGREKGEELAQPCVSLGMKSLRDCQESDRFKDNSYLQSLESVQKCSVSGTARFSENLCEHLSEKDTVSQFDKDYVNENSEKLSDTYHDNCMHRNEFMQLKNEQNGLICDQLFDLSAVGSELPVTEPVLSNTLENTKNMKSTRFVDNEDCISLTDANLCYSKESCHKHMQILNNSNIFMKKHEICDLSSDIKLSKSENMCNVVKTATQIQQTKCTPHAAGDHGKFQKTEFWDINSSLNQNQHLEYEFTEENSPKSAQDFYHNDELKDSVKNWRITETQGTFCARNSISDFCLPPDNLCLCQKEINLQHKGLSECSPEKRNETVLKTSACAEYLTRFGDMELTQKEITPIIRETASPTELKQGSIVTEMNIGLNSVDQKESVKHSNMEELALRPQECENDQASSKSEKDSARDHSIPRDICLMNIPDSDNRQEHKSYNPNIHQDLSDDQMSGLSQFEFTSQDRAGYNQVVSEKSTLPCDIPVINSTDQVLHSTPLTSATEFENCTCKKHSRHISDITESKNKQIITECVCKLETINSNQSGHVIKGSNFKANKTGNQFRVFEGKQPESFDSVLKDGDYYFNIAERLDIQGSGGSELCVCSDTELTDIKSASLSEPVDYDVVDGQIFPKSDKFGFKVSQDGVKLCSEIDLSSKKVENTFSQILPDVSAIDKSITVGEQCRVETNLNLDAHSVNESNINNQKEISEGLISVGETPKHNTSQTATLTVQQSFEGDNCDFTLKRQDSTENGEKLPEFPIKSKFIKTGSNLNIKQIATSCTDDSHAIRSTDSSTEQSLISHWGSIKVQNSTNRVCVNAGEALCDNVSDITDLFDDKDDDFVDAEETLGSELDTADIDITNSSSCDSDLNKQGDILFECDLDDIASDAISGIVTGAISNAGYSNGHCTDIYKCRESLTSTESFQDAFDDFIEDPSNAFTLQGDKTPENENFMSQISSSLSRCSQKSFKDDKNVDINGKAAIISKGDSILVQNLDDSMERRRRREISTITTIVTGSSTVKHVHASEFRNSPAINDNAYQCNTPSSDLKETQHTVQTNVSRSSDKRNESEHGVIANVIHKTRSTVLPVDTCIPQTGEKEALSSQTPNEPAQSTFDSVDKKNEIESENQPAEFIIKNETPLPTSVLHSSTAGGSHEKSCSSTYNVTNGNNSITTAITTCSEDSSKATKESLSNMMSSEKIGRKIETAVTIRTQRRRRRQGQQIDTQSELNACSNSVPQERADLCDLSGETEYNAGVNKNSKIGSDGSTLISSRSESVTFKDVSASVSEDSIENKSCSQLSDSNTLRSIENVPESKDFDSILPSDSQDSSFIEQQTDSDVCDNTIVLTQSENKLTSCERSVNLSSADTTGNETKLVGDDVTKNEPLISVSCNSDRNFGKESNSNDVRIDQSPFTVSVQKVPSHVNDNNFDDIEFIDADDIPEVQKECPSSGETKEPNDRSRKSESPNASFTLTFEIASDEEILNNDIEAINKSSSDSGSNAPGLPENKNSIIGEVNDTEYVLPDQESEEILENVETNIVINDKVQECINDSDISVSVRSDPSSCETTNEQDPKNGVNLAAHSETRVGKNVSGIEIQVRPLAESYTSDIEDPEIQEADIGNQDDDLESVVSEESNISVAHALKLEREKLNEFNNNCSNTEESGRSRSRTPGRRNVRSASTGNFILQLQKSETEDVNTVLSNIKSGLSKRSIKKSSSFRIERKNAYSEEEENDDNIDTMKNAGKKVSDICRSFVQKARSSSRPRADEESGMVKSPTPQRKLMKWVNDNGKWLRIPVNETIGDRKDKETICQQTEDIASEKHGARGKIQGKLDLQIPSEEAKEHCEEISAEYNTGNINVVITDNTDTTDSQQVVHNRFSVKEIGTDKSEDIIENAVSAPSSTDHDNATDTPFVVDTNEVKSLMMSQSNLLPSPKTLTSEENLACEQESFHRENKDRLLAREQTQSDQKTNDSKTGTAIPGAVPSIVCPPPTKLKPKLHLDIQKAHEKSDNDSSELIRPYTAPVENTHENSYKESPKMNRSDFLLGIKDNMSRRKLVKMLSPTRSPQEPDFKSSGVDPETTPDETIPSPKRIPKLTAVKIQEEIFEGKPEYMKLCNIDPLGIREELKTEKNLLSYFNSKREMRELKRSRTFTSMEDAKTGSKSHTFETKDTKVPKPSIHDYRESEMLQAPGGAADESDILTDVVERATTAKSDKRKLKVPILMRDRSLQRPKLLSEIVEVEENKDELQQTANNNRSKQQGEHEQQQPSNKKKERKLRKSGTTGNKRRSLSLPTGSLAFGDARIVYKNGHFTIETMEDYEFDSTRPPDSDEDNDPNFVNKMHVTADSSSRRREGVVVKDYAREATHLQQPGLKRQRGKTALTKRDSDDSVFYNEAYSVNHVNEDANEIRSSSSHLPEISHGSGDLERDNDFYEHQKSNQSSSSLPETASSPSVKQEALRARRTSSFRRAQESGVLRHTDHSEEQVKDDPNQKIPSSNESNQNASSSKTTPKKKSLNENMTLFSKQSESAKDFFSKKMNLRGLFKKNKPDLGLTSGSPLKLQHPVSPPIAAFQGDDDIGSIDTPPGSPGPRRDFRRRHTSADVYIRSFADATASESGSNCPTPTQERHNSSRQAVSTPTTPSRESNSIMNLTANGSVCTIDEDRISVTSASSAASSSHSSIQSPGMEQPHKPKTPKPVGASPRRSHSIGSQASRTSYQFVHRDRTSTSVTSLESDNCDDMLSEISIEGRCECEYKASFPRSRSDSKASVDSIQLCQFCKNYLEYVNNSGLTSGASVDKHRKSSSRPFSLDDNISAKSRKDSSSSRTSYEKLAIITQQDVVSSNSNDSGIQRDVSAHSSNESIKGTQDTPVKLRRKKSLSPHTERPKSEAGVRWADLDLEASGFNQPVRFRSSARRFKDRPRPKSDLDDSIQLFDELFEEILEDFETEGSSFLSDRMKAFGSEINLQPYCSLRNLYDMRKQEFDKRKNRRMSTPHPIKSRLQRSPKKLQKQPPLVRSSSMPESLDKITKRRKLHLLDFHMDSLQRHLDAEDCYSDDSDLSFDHVSLQERSLSIQSSQSQLTSMDEEEDNLIYAEALWDHITMVPDEIGFRAQDVIEVMDMRDKDWWYGAIDDKEGWFPAAFVRLRVNQDQIEEEDLEMTLQDNLTSSPKSRRISMLNKNQARTNVVNEIINAEREYVKHLKDVVEGYIQHARKRSEMFPEERIALIFGNIETIYSFARKFLGHLEKCIDVCPHLSEIGQCFLDNERGFEVYSDYCNNHPSACEELKELCQDSKYRHFFEACRLLQDLVEIPLEGFLLTPVQKICKYPLQLAELLKYTPPDHSDYETVKDALSAMRKIATLINERKRKMESIEKIAAWQHTVADWDGEDLLERSSELIFSGEINKVNTAGWSQERYFFLFDHQLIYCKKELLKRHVFSYKGRIDLDHCDVIDVFDGRDVQYNVSVKHAWKLHETHKDKWYLLYSKTQAGKERWLKALRDERKRVQEDRDNDFCVPDHWKQTVLNKVRSQSSLKDKQPTSRVNPSHQVPFQKDLKDFAYSTLPRRRISSHKQDKKKGWFFFGGKKSKR